jgi:glutathionylspermidine synthase
MKIFINEGHSVAKNQDEYTEAYMQVVDANARIKYFPKLVHTAVNSLVKGVVVGITKDNTVIMFTSNGYDNKGNVSGEYKVLPKIGSDGKGAYYLASSTYSKDSMKKLGYTEEDRKKVLKDLKQFKSYEVT